MKHGLALGAVVAIAAVSQCAHAGPVSVVTVAADRSAGALAKWQPSLKLGRPDGMRALGGNTFLMAENTAEVGRISLVTVEGDKAEIKVLKTDPGVTAMTKVGNMVWVNNAKFAYRATGPLKDQSPEPFVEYAIPFSSK